METKEWRNVKRSSDQAKSREPIKYDHLFERKHELYGDTTTTVRSHLVKCGYPRDGVNKMVSDIMRSTRDPLELVLEYCRVNITGAAATKEPGRTQSSISYHARNLIDMITRLTPGCRGGHYLDIGCGSGSITREIGAGTSAASITGVDIETWVSDDSSGASADTSLIIRMIDESNPVLPDAPGGASYSLISAIMSLHHVRELEKMLGEITRVLRPGGVLAIREHDVRDDSTRADLVNFQHLLYHVLEGVRDQSAADSREDVARSQRVFAEKFHSHYYSADQWDEMLASRGFRRAGDPYRDMISETRPTVMRGFYQLYVFAPNK